LAGPEQGRKTRESGYNQRGEFAPVRPPSAAIRISLPTLGETERLAARVAALAAPGDFIGLSGPLGAGKTAFARAFLLAMAARQGVAPPSEVPSPTFTLVQSYALGAVEVAHFDLYRLRSPEEARELGIDEAQQRVVVLVEWPERLADPRLADRRPRDRLDVTLTLDADEVRTASLAAHGSWQSRASRLAPP